MDSARWDLVQAVFHEAVERPPHERHAYVAARCVDDAALAAEVTALLEEDERGASILDRDVGTTASRLLASDATEPRQIGPYTLTRVLGEGGMGVVYLARRDDLGSTAAIKILRDAWLSPARRERFAVEQRTLAHLQHPRIARLYDAGALADGTPWIAMAYVDGVSLTEYCRATRAALDTRLRLLAEVCDAVQYAHRHLVVHRDLKPSNVLVSGDGHATLLDFGIAKALGDTGARPSAQADAAVTVFRPFTPAYASPEQMRGDPVGVAGDVYSLGVMLYELLTGRLPFDLASRTPAEAAAVVAATDPPRSSETARASTRASAGAPVGLPDDPGRAAWADLDVLCQTAMHRDPRRRYPSVEALGRDIEAFLTGRPLEARRDTVAYRVRKFVGRHKAPLAATAAGVLMLAAMATYYTVRLTTARNAAVLEAARSERLLGLMLNLFTGGDEAAGPAGDLRVVTLVERGVQEARSLTGEPAVQAEMFGTLGGIYEQLGDLDRANTLLEAALERRRALSGPDSPEVADGLVALGRLRATQSKFDDAERLVREGVEMSVRRRGPADPASLRAAMWLGHVQVERGQYAAGTATLSAAAARHPAGVDSTDLEAVLRELTNAYFYEGRFDEADRLGQRVLAMARRLHGPRHPFVADDLINLGAVRHERGEYVEAEGFYREALPITEGWYGQNHYRTASNLTMLGRTLVFQNRHDEAVELLQRAVRIQERVFGASHPRVASAVNELGSVALQRGRYDDAEAAYRRMLAIYHTAYGDKHYLIATATSNLGSVSMARQDNREAERLFREAIAMFSDTLSPTHTNTAIGRLKLGRVLLRQGRYAEAEASTLAGYETLSKETSPAVTWLKAGRDDLVKIFTATGRPDRAAQIRAAQAAIESR